MFCKRLHLCEVFLYTYVVLIVVIYNVCREAVDAENCGIGTQTSREDEEAGISEGEEARTSGNNINLWNFFKVRQRWQEEEIN